MNEQKFTSRINDGNQLRNLIKSSILCRLNNLKERIYEIETHDHITHPNYILLPSLKKQVENFQKILSLCGDKAIGLLKGEYPL